jgi:hypothetical protein
MATESELRGEGYWWALFDRCCALREGPLFKISHGEQPQSQLLR